MDVQPPLVADGEAPKAPQPSKGPLDDPAMPPQRALGLDPDSRDAHPDPPPMQKPATVRLVESFVGMELVRTCMPLATGTADRGHRINQLLKLDRFLAVGRGHAHRQRQSLAVGDQMVRGTGLAAIDRIGTGRLAPLFAGMLLASTRARSQSSCPAAPSRSSSTWCRASHTPACCQSRRRRQQVMPEPHPSSCGSRSQGMPVQSTKRMPVRQARSGMRGRPPFGLGGQRAAAARDGPQLVAHQGFGHDAPPGSTAARTMPRF